MKPRENVRKLRRLLAGCLTLMLLLALPCTGYAAGTETSVSSSGQTAAAADEGAVTTVTFDDLEGKTVGVLTGTPQDEFVKAKVKDPNILYFNDSTDLALALQQNKIDYFVNSTISYRIMSETYPDFAYIDAVFKSFDIGTIFAKNDTGKKLQSEMNEYIAGIKEDGTLDKLKDYWLNPNDWEAVSIPTEGKNGTLKMGAISTMKPFCFVIGEGYGGLDTAVIAGFCEKYGYGLQVENVDFSGALSGVSAGKYDLAAGQISYTEERAESVLYSDFYCSQDIVPIVRKADYPAAADAASSSNQSESAEPGEVTGVSFDDLDGKKAGVLTGTPQEDFVKAKVNNPELLYYNDSTDLALALQQNKIDYFVNSTISYRIMSETYPDFAYIDAVFKSFDIGTIFAKNDNGKKLQSEMNEYIAGIKEDGTLDKLKDYWLNPNDWEAVTIPTEGKNGTLKMGAISTMKPFCFVIGEGYGGLDTAVIAGFCEKYGYGLQVENVDFSGALSGVSAGKYDLAAGQISYTDERAESVLYSDFYCSQDIVPIVRKADYADKLSQQESTQSGAALEEGALTDYTLDDLQGKTGGVLTGTPQDEFVKAKIKDPDFVYYDSFTDEAVALQQGKIDYCINSTISFRIMRDMYPEFSYIAEPLKSLDIGTILPQTDKGSELQGELNEYIDKIKGDGTLDELQKYWLYPNDWEEVSIPSEGENGTLTMGGITTMKPFCFVINDGFGGLDTAIIAGFCEEYGYGLKIENTDFSGALSGVAAGKFDLAAGQIAYTDERAETVLYSEFYSQQDIVPFVRTADYVSSEDTTEAEDNQTFFGSLKKSIYRTLIQEKRYKMILSGLEVTLIMTLLGFLIANLFGALFCAMAMSKSRILHVLADIYSRIMQGTPMVVILMILYYGIFRSGRIPGIVVASFGFGLTSGAYLAQLFEGAIRGVDRGQSEAALAMGFSRYSTFTGIVLPQAIRSMLAGYFSQLISLMKATAIVGYIAVTDLTKAGDIIRGATFEPFVPLLVVAILYLLIACILLSVLKMIQKKLAPKRVMKKKKGGKN